MKRWHASDYTVPRLTIAGVRVLTPTPGATVPDNALVDGVQKTWRRRG